MISKIRFFHNERSVVAARLTVENERDRLSVYGELDVSLNAGAVALVDRLRTLVDTIMAEVVVTIAERSCAADLSPVPVRTSFLGGR